MPGYPVERKTAMRRVHVLPLVCAFLPALAQRRVMTLREAVELAARQNPDVVLARLDEQRASLGIAAVREPDCLGCW